MAQQQPPGGVRLPLHLQPRPKAAATASSSGSSLDGLREDIPSRQDGQSEAPNPRPRTASPSQSRRAGTSPLNPALNPSSLDTGRSSTTPATASRAASRARSRSPQVATGAARSRSSNPTPAARGIDTSDEATEAFVRRVLCPYSDSALSGQQALDELLPPLTSSNAVDLQLYAILAVVIKEFVASWYAKITPDQTFVEEVIRIIAHCTRELEQRLRRLNLTSLLLDEIPTLVQDHVKAFRTSSDPDQSPGLASDRHAIYHALHPHPAFTPVPSAGDSGSEETQAANESYYRQLLVYGALAVLLPTEDLQSPPLRILVADVLGEMILGRGISQRACEGWLIWDGITKAAGSIKRHVEPKATGEEVEIGTRGRLEQFGLLAEQSAANRATRARHRRSSASGFVWRVLQYAYLTYAAIHFLIAGLAAAATGPAMRHSSRKAQSIDASLAHGASEETDRGRSPMASTMEAPGADSSPRPILSYAIWDLVGKLIDLPGRAPWTLGGLAFARWHLTQPMGWLMGIGATDGAIDKFLHVLIATHLLRASRIPPSLLQLRLALFPNNSLAPTRIVPSPEEQLAIRRQAAAAILSLVPHPLARLFLNTRFQSSLNEQSGWHAALRPSIDDSRGPRSASRGSAASRRSSVSPAPRRAQPSGTTATSPLAVSMTIDDVDSESSVAGETTGEEDGHRTLDVEEQAMLQDVERILDVFGDAYMNKHLIFGIVELLFVRLMPELGEKGVRELLEERGVAV